MSSSVEVRKWSNLRIVFGTFIGFILTMGESITSDVHCVSLSSPTYAEMIT